MPGEGLYRLLRATAVPALLRRTAQRRRVTVLLYHAVPADVLGENLAVLTRRYRFITLGEYLDARAAGTTRALPSPAAILTLDDGHAANRDLLPVLRKYGVRPTIFLCTRIVGTRRRFWFRHPAARGEGERLKRLADAERLARLRERGFEDEAEHAVAEALSWEDVEAMRPWVDFEPHSLTHPVLPRCDEAKARDEIVRSREDLVRRGFSARCFAYPNGDYGAREADLAREAGFEAALTIDFGYNGDGTDPFRLRRIGIPDSAGPEEAIVRASGLWSAIRVLLRGRYQTAPPGPAEPRTGD